MRLIRLLAIAVLPALLWAGCGKAPVAEAPPAAPAPSPRPAAAPTDRLLGKWLRPDGGYVLEIKAARPEGLLEASYFNPRPIHVSKAAWKSEPADGFGVFVELTDEGYPGATYRLRHSPASDKLTGTYTQPAANQTYDVEFVRMNSAN